VPNVPYRSQQGRSKIIGYYLIFGAGHPAISKYVMIVRYNRPVDCLCPPALCLQAKNVVSKMYHCSYDHTFELIKMTRKATAFPLWGAVESR